MAAYFVLKPTEAQTLNLLYVNYLSIIYKASGNSETCKVARPGRGSLGAQDSTWGSCFDIMYSLGP